MVSVKLAAFCIFICNSNKAQIISSIIEFKLSLYVDDLLLYCMLWKLISTFLALYGSFFGFQMNLSKSEYYLAHVQSIIYPFENQCHQLNNLV